MSPNNQNEASIQVNKGKVDSINIYEITESELETLESASPTGILFDIGLACVSVAISLTVTLATTKIENDRTYYSFLIFTIIGYLAFGAFLVIWLVTRKSVKKITKEIRNRINPTKNQLNVADSTE